MPSSFNQVNIDSINNYISELNEKLGDMNISSHDAEIYLREIRNLEKQIDNLWSDQE